MIFSQETMEVGGKITLPHSFVNSQDAGEITEVTQNGIQVLWFKGTKNQQKGYFSYGWLNQTYGSNDLNDDLPF